VLGQSLEHLQAVGIDLESKRAGGGVKHAIEQELEGGARTRRDGNREYELARTTRVGRVSTLCCTIRSSRRWSRIGRRSQDVIASGSSLARMVRPRRSSHGRTTRPGSAICCVALGHDHDCTGPSPTDRVGDIRFVFPPSGLVP
jgi:hypothetical protein